MEKELIEDLGSLEVTCPLPFSLGTRAGKLVFLSGMVSKDMLSGKADYGDVAYETKKIFENIDKLLQIAGSSSKKILKATVYLRDMSYFDEMNKVYASYFDTKEKMAARSTVEAKLAGEYKVEIEVVALV